MTQRACKRLGHSIGAWPAQLAHAFVQWRGRFTARSTHKSDRFLHQRAVGFARREHARRAQLRARPVAGCLGRGPATIQGIEPLPLNHNPLNDATLLTSSRRRAAASRF